MHKKLENFIALMVTGLLSDCSEFCGMVKKIFIYTSEEVKRLSPKIKHPAEEEVKGIGDNADAAVNTEDRSSTIGPGCWYSNMLVFCHKWLEWKYKKEWWRENSAVKALFIAALQGMASAVSRHAALKLWWVGGWLFINPVICREWDCPYE